MTFIAALDQSGGSTPGALKRYGIECGENNMFDLIHEMRLRIIGSDAFTNERIDSAILFKDSLDRGLGDLLIKKGIMPYLKVDNGMEENGLMKPLDMESVALEAPNNVISGTKMRSVVQHIDMVPAIVEQQLHYAQAIASMGLTPIIEPEVDINNPFKNEIEEELDQALLNGLSGFYSTVILKLTIPTTPTRYAMLAGHPSVERIVALSGGYSQVHACHLLQKLPHMSASFSRALLEGLFFEMSKEEFDDKLDKNIEKIYKASE